MTTAEAIRGMVEALRSHAGCTHCRSHPGQHAARALAAWEQREPLRNDATVVLAAADALGDARNDPRKWTNVDMAEAALDAIDRHLFGERAAEPNTCCYGFDGVHSDDCKRAAEPGKEQGK